MKTLCYVLISLLGLWGEANAGETGHYEKGFDFKFERYKDFQRKSCGAKEENPVLYRNCLKDTTRNLEIEDTHLYFGEFCNEPLDYPEDACLFYLKFRVENDDLMWNTFCGPLLEAKNTSYYKYCGIYVDMLMEQNSPWLDKKIRKPCLLSANGPDCDREMLDLCINGSMLCDKLYTKFTPKIYEALATNSPMCQNDDYPLKTYCDGVQKSVIDHEDWMGQYCAPYRSAHQLCKLEWPPACQIYKTVCKSGKRQNCSHLAEQEAFCKEIDSIDGAEGAYDKYCSTGTNGTVDNRYCTGVNTELQSNKEKFTKVCTQSCTKKDEKLCAYCQNLIEEDPRLLWAQCHNTELLESAYCKKIITYCRTYTSTTGCGQVLREYLLWGMELGNATDLSAMIANLVKLCEGGANAECASGLNATLATTSFVQLHSQVCAKFKAVCENIVASVKDDLDSLTSVCDASTWANFTSCQIVMDECINKNYSCPGLLEKGKSSDDFNKFNGASPADKKKFIEQYCAENKVSSSVCQSFLDQGMSMTTTEQNAIIPAICEDKHPLLCKELISRLVQKNGDDIGQLAKQQCSPWKKTEVFCTVLDTACQNVTTRVCADLHKIQCQAPASTQLKECYSTMNHYCKGSPPEGDPNYETCKLVSETIAENANSHAEVSRLCESTAKDDQTLCQSILDNAEKVGKLKDLTKGACSKKEKLKTALCQKLHNKCEIAESEDCDKVKGIEHDVNFDPKACKTESKQCQQDVAWYCVKIDDTERNDGADMSALLNKTQADRKNAVQNADSNADGGSVIRDRAHCKQLIDNMDQEVAVKYHRLCIVVPRKEVCDITTEKLSADGNLYSAFSKHCTGFTITASARGCQVLYDYCTEYHPDGSAGCEKLISEYELRIALSEVSQEDFAKTAKSLATICGPGKDEATCKGFIKDNKTSDSLILGGLQEMCDEQANQGTCRKIIGILMKDKSPILDKISTMCVTSVSKMCDQLSELCKKETELPVCKKMAAAEKQREDIKDIDNDPSKSAAILKKYCAENTTKDPEICELVKTKILANPDFVVSELGKYCEISAQLCLYFTQGAITANESLIAPLHKKYCSQNIEQNVCTNIQEYCAGSALQECKATRSRICYSEETIDKCMVAIEKECGYNHGTRTTAQIEACADLVQQAANTKSKINKLQVMCEGNATACAGFVAGTLDSKNGYSVFETWCPKQDYKLRKCKQFRELCNLRKAEADCARINALYGDFDPLACKDKDAKICDNALTENCDVKIPSAEQKHHCDELFANMGKDDLIKQKSKCLSGAEQKTCTRIVEQLRGLGALATAFEDWCKDRSDFQTHQCLEIKETCDKTNAEGCSLVLKAYNRPKRIGSIVGMIIGALITILGIVFWVILGVNQSKYDEEKDKLKQEKKEEKKRQKMEKKKNKKMDETTTSAETTEGSTFGPM